jgi:hypothetical protein
MSPEVTTSSGGTVGHAASGTAKRRDAACAEDFRVLARCAAVMGFAVCMLAVNAPTLWPRLFAH